MKIGIIGTGYVGLVSGVCLAAKGHEVTCVDLRTQIVEQLNNGKPHIHEAGLESLLEKVIKSNNFEASADIRQALDQNDLLIIAVGTPSENGEIDLGQIYSVAKAVGEYIKHTDRYLSIVVKSTVIPGTTDTFVKNTIAEFSGKQLGAFGLGMNPEFLREGDAIEDFMFPDRIVIGSEDEITKSRLAEIYAPWDTDKIFVNTRTAEMIKYANNTVLAGLISLNNELANLAGTLGNIDYNDVVYGVSLDKRWSPILDDGNRIVPKIITYLTPGAGFGGSCFPKDVQAIRTQGLHKGLEMNLTNAILDVNENQALNAINILKKKAGTFNGKKILMLGLAFKPGTDDVRESSAVKILKILSGDISCQIYAHDPIANLNNEVAAGSFRNVNFITNWRTELLSADVVIIGTNWAEYNDIKQLDRDGLLKNKIVFDTKRLFGKSDLVNTDYCTIGYNPN